MVDGAYYQDLLRPIFSRRRVVIVGLPLAGSTDLIKRLRSLGAARCLVIASGPGTGTERWGVGKPDPRFFQHVSDAMQLPPAPLSHVGDRLDNDIAPAARAGMMAIFLRRGPWAEVIGNRPERRHERPRSTRSTSYRHC